MIADAVGVGGCLEERAQTRGEYETELAFLKTRLVDCHLRVFDNLQWGLSGSDIQAGAASG